MAMARARGVQTIIAVVFARLLGGAPAFPLSATVTTLHRRPTLATSLDRPYDRWGVKQNANSPTREDGELGLITFDLDDTIFPIGPVVADANVAQLRALRRLGYDDASNEGILLSSKRIRTKLREAAVAITYTDLRKRSIRSEIERATRTADGDGWTVHDSVVEAVFDAWLLERHASADRNLFPHASGALEVIREEHPAAVIGAITNGRGNPLDMPSLREYFDFCVSGEDEGVFPRRKPDRGIYEAAVGKYEELRGEPMTDGTWIHVGDDLANDVGASAACGARAIWFSPGTNESGGDSPTKVPGWSTATEEELQMRSKMDTLAKEHVSVRIASLKDLPGAIAEVLNRSISR